MFCPKCGIKVDDKANFCCGCGEKIVNETDLDKHDNPPNKSLDFQSQMVNQHVKNRPFEKMPPKYFQLFTIIAILAVIGYLGSSETNTSKSSVKYSTSEHSGTYCQTVNKTGRVENAGALAQTTSKWLRKKGVDYGASTQEITTTIKNYCRSNPYASADDATDHLVNIINVTAELSK